VLCYAVTACRLKKLNEEFYEHVDTAEVAEILDVDLDTVDYMYSYWVFKRKVVFSVFITSTGSSRGVVC